MLACTRGIASLRCSSTAIISGPFKVLDGALDSNIVAYQEGQLRSETIKPLLLTLLAKIMRGGGEKAIQRHTVGNKKLLIRDRLKLIFDKESPVLEIAPLAGLAMEYGDVPAAGSVAQIGKIHGHWCLVGGSDATVKGGTVFPIGVNKQIRMQQMSLLNFLPCVSIIDSGGAFLPLQSEIFPDSNGGGRTFYNQAICTSSGIRQIAIVDGSCTAGAAYVPTMAEEAIIVNKIGTLYLAGPPLVKAATGEIVTDEYLGGADLHCRVSGCTDFFAETEHEAFQMCRETVATFNLPELLPKPGSIQEPLFPADELSTVAGKAIITKQDMYKILSRILDGSMFKEFKATYGTNLISGFGFLHGHLTGILANCGPLSTCDAMKGSHFIQLCYLRDVPLVFLQNSGAPNEQNQFWSQGEVLKDRAKMIAAQSCIHTPKIVINIGGCYGDDNYTMCGWSFEPNFLFSWPLACTAFDDPGVVPSNKQAIALDDLLYDPTSAFFRSAHVLQDGIILPEDTRPTLAMCLDIAMRGYYLRRQWRSKKTPLYRM